MKRNAGGGKVLYQLAAVGIVLASLATVVATAGLVWLTYGDFVREFPAEKLVPRLNIDNVNKATDILKKKEASLKIDLKTREVKFGREEPFD